MRRFGTQGRVYPERHYVVPRTEEISEFNNRVKEGRYIVLSAPRQTGKTTFFKMALDTLTTEDPTYFPIQLDFQVMRKGSPPIFYERLSHLIHRQIEYVLKNRGMQQVGELTQFFEKTQLSDHFSMVPFFEELSQFLDNKKIVLLIDEFDGIPQDVVSDFLYTLRYIYLSDEFNCLHSVGIVGVRSISQLNYDRSVSPFNIQDEFRLPNFMLNQVQDLFGQYTDETGQEITSDIIESIHKQTAGQPVLVNRFGQLLTEEMDISKTERITRSHFSKAHTDLLRERNVNIQHLTTNVRRDRRYESILMKIMARDEGVNFNLDDDIISDLATFGVIREGSDNMCEIANPIYLYRIMRTFKLTFNGLEYAYFSEEKDECFIDFLTSTGHINMVSVLDNFQDFIARIGFRILQIPDTPQEYIGQHLLYTYLEQSVHSIGGNLYLEVQTGRGRMDLLLIHNQQKYIVETKIWEGNNRYAAGKSNLPYI